MDLEYERDSIASRRLKEYELSLKIGPGCWYVRNFFSLKSETRDSEIRVGCGRDKRLCNRAVDNCTHNQHQLHTSSDYISIYMDCI